jgi:SAM-dependent methyltransferase
MNPLHAPADSFVANSTVSESGARLPDLYAMDAGNGWAQGMRAVSLALLARQPIIKGPFLDLGCGSGMFVHELAGQRPQALVLGADLSGTALAYARARSGGEQLLQVDVGYLPLAPASIGLVTALDSFDQVGVDIDRTLREVRRVLRPGGLLLIRVSAHPWLWGPHDVAFNTGRRWRLGDLVEHVQRADLTVARTTYANSLLSPPLVLLRLLQKRGWLSDAPAAEASGWSHALLRRALGVEARWLERHRFPFGISAYVLAQLPKPSDEPVLHSSPHVQEVTP